MADNYKDLINEEEVKDTSSSNATQTAWQQKMSNFYANQAAQVKAGQQAPLYGQEKSKQVMNPNAMSQYADELTQGSATAALAPTDFAQTAHKAVKQQEYDTAVKDLYDTMSNAGTYSGDLDKFKDELTTQEGYDRIIGAHNAWAEEQNEANNQAVYKELNARGVFPESYEEFKAMRENNPEEVEALWKGMQAAREGTDTVDGGKVAGSKVTYQQQGVKAGTKRETYTPGKENGIATKMSDDPNDDRWLSDDGTIIHAKEGGSGFVVPMEELTRRVSKNVDSLYKTYRMKGEEALRGQLSDLFFSGDKAWDVQKDQTRQQMIDAAVSQIKRRDIGDIENEILAKFDQVVDEYRMKRLDRNAEIAANYADPNWKIDPEKGAANYGNEEMVQSLVDEYENRLKAAGIDQADAHAQQFRAQVEDRLINSKTNKAVAQRLFKSPFWQGVAEQTMNIAGGFEDSIIGKVGKIGQNRSPYDAIIEQAAKQRDMAQLGAVGQALRGAVTFSSDMYLSPLYKLPSLFGGFLGNKFYSTGVRVWDKLIGNKAISALVKSGVSESEAVGQVMRQYQSTVGGQFISDLVHESAQGATTFFGADLMSGAFDEAFKTTVSADMTPTVQRIQDIVSGQPGAMKPEDWVGVYNPDETTLQAMWRIGKAGLTRGAWGGLSGACFVGGPMFNMLGRNRNLAWKFAADAGRLGTNAAAMSMVQGLEGDDSSYGQRYLQNLLNLGVMDAPGVISRARAYSQIREAEQRKMVSTEQETSLRKMGMPTRDELISQLAGGKVVLPETREGRQAPGMNVSLYERKIGADGKPVELTAEQKANEEQINNFMHNGDVPEIIRAQYYTLLTGKEWRVSMPSSVGTVRPERGNTGRYAVDLLDDYGNVIETHYYASEGEALRGKDASENAITVGDLDAISSQYILNSLNLSFQNEVDAEYAEIASKKRRLDMANSKMQHGGKKQLSKRQQRLVEKGLTQHEQDIITLSEGQDLLSSAKKKQQAGEDLTEQEQAVVDASNRLYTEKAEKSTHLQDFIAQYEKANDMEAGELLNLQKGHETKQEAYDAGDGNVVQMGDRWYSLEEMRTLRDFRMSLLKECDNQAGEFASMIINAQAEQAREAAANEQPVQPEQAPAEQQRQEAHSAYSEYLNKTFEAGKALQGKDRTKANKEYKRLDAELQQAGVDTEGIEAMLQNGQHDQLNDYLQTVDPKIRNKVTAFIHASETCRGMMDVIEQQRQQEIATAHEAIDRQTGDDGNVTAITLKNGRVVYLKKGALKINDDGSVNRGATEKSLAAIDAETGEPVQVDPADIDTTTIQSPDALKEQKSAEITEAIKAQHTPELEGQLGFNPGDVYDVAINGEKKVARVLENNGDGTVRVELDGKETVVRNEDLQRMADDLYNTEAARPEPVQAEPVQQGAPVEAPAQPQVEQPVAREPKVAYKEGGEIDYEKSDPADVFAELEKQGEGSAVEMAENMIAEAQARLKAAEETKIEGNSFAEKQASQKARNEAKREAQAAIDFWNKVASEGERRTNEAAAAQEPQTEEERREQAAVNSELPGVPKGMLENLARATGLTVRVGDFEADFNGNVGQTSLYDANTRTILINPNAPMSQRVEGFLGHETWHNFQDMEGVEDFQKLLFKMRYGTETAPEDAIMDIIDRYSRGRIIIDKEQAVNELTANVLKDVIFSGKDGARRFTQAIDAANGDMNKMQRFVARLRDWVDIASEYFGLKEMNEYGQSQRALQEARDIYTEWLKKAREYNNNPQNTIAKEEPLRDEHGEVTAVVDNKHQIQHNFETYMPWVDNFGREHEGSRARTIAYMKAREFSDDDIKRMTDVMDYWYDYLSNLSKFTDENGNLRFQAFHDWNKKHPLYHSIGGTISKAISTRVKNGEYANNLELTTDCIKREAFTQLMNTMVNRGADLRAMGPREITVIQDMMKQYGIQVACPLCFVEGKRLQIVNWAKTIVDDWNDALRECQINPDEVEGFNFGKDGDDFIPDAELATLDKGEAKSKAWKMVNDVYNILTDPTHLDKKQLTARNQRAYDRRYKEMAEAWLVAHPKKSIEDFKPTKDQKKELAGIRNFGIKSVEAVKRNTDAYALRFAEMEQAWKEKNPDSDKVFEPTQTQWAELDKIRNKQVRDIKSKMVRLIAEHPEMRKSMKLNDLLGSKGLMEIRQQNGEAFAQLYSLILGRFGSGTPKPIQDAVPYDCEVIEISDSLVNKAATEGGTRMFSFSDYDITKTFDYMQAFFDLAARKMKLQSYTKEAPYVLTFGQTGAKINMSTLPKAVVTKALETAFRNARNKDEQNAIMHAASENAGLVIDEKTGKIVDMSWSEEHSLKPDFCKQIFHDDRFNANVGATTVGASVNHSIWAASQAWIRQVIPFHLSGMPMAARERTDVKWYFDNTPYQNTMVKNAKGEYVSIHSEWAKKHKTKDGKKYEDFNFYEGEENPEWDFRQRCRDYVAWCKEKGYKPRFEWGLNSEEYRKYCEDQGFEPNQEIIDIMDNDMTDGVWNGYYKFIADYNPYKPVFDEAGNYVGDIKAPHKPVEANFAMDDVLKGILFEDNNSMLQNRENSIRNANENMTVLADKTIGYLNGDVSEAEMVGTGDRHFENQSDADLWLETQIPDDKVMFNYEGGEKNPAESLQNSGENRTFVGEQSAYRQYTSPEAREAAATDSRFAGWKHPECAYISAAAWAGARIPAEELLKDEKVNAAQTRCDELNAKRNSDPLTLPNDQQAELVNRLLSINAAVGTEKNGKWKISKRDGQDDFTGEVKQDRKAFIVIGRPAGGKSSVFANPLSGQNSARIIDSDVVKEWLPGFEEGLGAGYTQDMSAEIADMALRIAAERGDNMVVPRIGGKSVIKTAIELREKFGYDVELYFNEVDQESSIMRAVSRFAQTGRYLDVKYLNGIERKPIDTFLTYAQADVNEAKEILKRLEQKENDKNRTTGEQSAVRGDGQSADLGEGSGENGTGAGVSETGTEKVALFSRAVWKNNDVAFGEDPKLIWDSADGGPMPDDPSGGGGGKPKAQARQFNYEGTGYDGKPYKYNSVELWRNMLGGNEDPARTRPLREALRMAAFNTLGYRRFPMGGEMTVNGRLNPWDEVDNIISWAKENTKLPTEVQKDIDTAVANNSGSMELLSQDQVNTLAKYLPANMRNRLREAYADWLMIPKVEAEVERMATMNGGETVEAFLDNFDRIRAEQVQKPKGERMTRDQIVTEAMKASLPKDVQYNYEAEAEIRDQQTKSGNFKKWFGDWQKDPEHASKVVDADGKPLVVSHGTNNYGFTVFNTRRNTAGEITMGAHFGLRDAAEDRINSKQGGDNTGIYDVYLDVKNPWECTDWFDQNDSYMITDLAKLALEHKDNKQVQDMWKVIRSWESWTKDFTDEELADNEHQFGDNPIYGLESYEYDGLGDLYNFVRGMIQAAGHDGIKYWNDAEGNGYSWAVFKPNQIKSAAVEGPMKNNGNFDATNDDIRFNYEADADYMDAINSKNNQAVREMVSDAAKREGFVTDETGKTIDLYHGTGKFGFTEFESKRPSGAIFTVDRASVSANYGGNDNAYAGRRKINVPYIDSHTTDGILRNANAVLDQPWRLATKEEREAVIANVEKDAKEVEKQIYELQSKDFDLPEDNEYDMLNAVAWVENIIYDAAGGRENGNEGDQLSQMLAKDFERYEENREVIREYRNKHYDELSDDARNYLSFLTGYKLGDVAIDAGYSMSKALSEKDIATVTGTSFRDMQELYDIVKGAKDVGSYHLYGKLGDKPLYIDAKDNAWYNLDFNGMRNTDDIVEWAKKEGYTSVVFKNIYDYGDKANVYAFFDKNQVKSADPVTYDNDGNVIPLSQRFKTGNDIRYNYEGGDDLPTDKVRGRVRRMPRETVQQFEERKRKYMAGIVDSNEQARQRTIDQIQAYIDNKQIGQMGKRDLKDLQTAVKDATPENLQETLHRAQHTLNGLQSKVTEGRIGRLLRFKVGDTNSRKMSIAKNVDEGTARVVKSIRGMMGDLVITGLEDERRMLNTEHASLNKEIETLKESIKSGTLVPEDLAAAKTRLAQAELEIGRNKEERRLLQEEMSKVITNNRNVTKAEVDAALLDLHQRQSDAAIGEGTWTEADADELLGYTIMQHRIAMLDAMAQKAVMDKAVKNAKDRLKTLEEEGGTESQKAIVERELRESEKMSDQALLEANRRGEEVVSQLEDLLANGKERLQNKLSAEKERKSQLILGTWQDFGKTSKEERQLISQYDRAENEDDNKTEWQRTKGWFKGVFGSFEYLAQHIAQNRIGTDSFFYKHFIEGPEGVMAAQNAAIENTRNSLKILNDKCEEIFGKKYVDVMRENEKVVDTDITRVITIKGMEVEEKMKMSKGSATYLYMVWKMPDGKIKMEHAGFDEVSMEQIKDFIGPDNIAWADWVQSDLLVNLREKYNETYRSLYNTSMANIPDYVPLKIFNASRHDDVDVAQINAPDTLNNKEGALMNRTFNLNEVDYTHSAYSVIAEHIANMEEWNAFARVRQDLNYVLSSTAIRNQLNENEAGLHNRLFKAAQIATRTYNPVTPDASKWVSALTKGLAGANIALRNTTALKQMLSLPAFLGYSQDPVFISMLLRNTLGQYTRNAPAFAATVLSAGEFGRYVMNDLANGNNPSTVTKWALSDALKWCVENIPSFRERIAKGGTGNVILDEMLEDGETWHSRLIAHIGKDGMAANGLVDATTCAIGMKTIHDYRLHQLYKEANRMFMNKEIDADQYQAKIESARKQALAEAEIYINGTQQSNHPAFLAPIQMDGDMASKIMTLYKNSPISYARKAVLPAQQLWKLRHWDELKTEAKNMYMEQGYGAEAAEEKAGRHMVKTVLSSFVGIALYGYGINWLWNWGGQGILGLLQSDDDEEKSVVKQAAEYGAPILNGVPGVDLLMSFLQEQEYNPVLLFALEKNLAADAKRYGWMSPTVGYDVLNTFTRMGIGIDLNTLTNTYLACEHLVETGVSADNRAKLLDYMLFMNTPNSNRKKVSRKVYMDDDIDTFMENIMRADKLCENDDWHKYLPGMRIIKEDQKQKMFKEYAEAHATEWQKAARDEAKANTTSKLIETYGDRDALQKAYESEKDLKKKVNLGKAYIKLLEQGDKQALSTKEQYQEVFNKMFPAEADKEQQLTEQEWIKNATMSDLVNIHAIKQNINQYDSIDKALTSFRNKGDGEGLKKYVEENRPMITQMNRMKGFMSTINKAKSNLRKCKTKEAYDRNLTVIHNTIEKALAAMQ